MSWQATSWAARQTAGSGGRKCVLLVIANHADPSGICFPGLEALATEAECSARAISVNLKGLEDKGLLRRLRRKRPNGSRTTDWIVLAPHSKDRGEMKDGSREQYPWEVCRAASDAEPQSHDDSSHDDCDNRHVISGGGPEEATNEEQFKEERPLAKSPEGDPAAIPLPGLEASGAPDHVDQRVWEIFSHWLTVFDPPRKNLSTSRRKLIERGLKETESADVCKTAINGLKVWRLRRPGSTDLGAIFGTRPGGSSLGDQIDFWVKKAEEGGMQMVGRVPTDLSGVPAVTAGTIRGLRDAVHSAAMRPGDSAEQASGRYAMEQLAARYGHEPVEGATNYRQTSAWRLIVGWVAP